MNTSNLNIFVVDNDTAVRNSLGLLLLSRGHVVQTFESGESFLASGKLHQCGCVILDLRMEPGISGLHVFQELKAQASSLVVLFLSGHGDISIAVDAVQNGAFGWLEKSCGNERLLEKVKEALVQAAKMGAKRESKQKADALWQKLTPREQEVARYVARGLSSKLIARELAPIETRTVDTHRAHLYEKLGMSNPIEIDRLIRDNEL